MSWNVIGVRIVHSSMDRGPNLSVRTINPWSARWLIPVTSIMNVQISISPKCIWKFLTWKFNIYTKTLFAMSHVSAQPWRNFMRRVKLQKYENCEKDDWNRVSTCQREEEKFTQQNFPFFASDIAKTQQNSNGSPHSTRRSSVFLSCPKHEPEKLKFLTF